MTTPDQGLDTLVAGIRCREVLADLSNLLDGALGEARVRALQAHLNECDRCSRFGGEVATLLATLRETMTPAPIAPDAAERLRAAVQRAQEQ